MTTRSTMLRATLVAAFVAMPTATLAACPQQLALYTEKENGYELRFRSPAPWEAAPNVGAIIELAFPDGQVIWGTTWMPNGTSWNQADLFSGCKLPGPLDEATGDPVPGSTEEELDACRIWKGVIYNLSGNDIDWLPYREDPAAETLLLTNLGPTIRYSGLVLSPGDEPHDVFTLSGCQE